MQKKTCLTGESIAMPSKEAAPSHLTPVDTFFFL